MDHVNFFYCIMANLLHEPWQFIFSYHGKIASWTMSKLLKNPWYVFFRQTYFMDHDKLTSWTMANICIDKYVVHLSWYVFLAQYMYLFIHICHDLQRFFAMIFWTMANLFFGPCQISFFGPWQISFFGPSKFTEQSNVYCFCSIPWKIYILGPWQIYLFYYGKFYIWTMANLFVEPWSVIFGTWPIIFWNMANLLNKPW